MAEKGKIKANLGNLLMYIGQLYRNPKDALKEYVSNVIDRWAESRSLGEQNGSCAVSILLTRDRVLVKSHSQPGRDRRGLKAMMEQVAVSMKPALGVAQIGRLGIGVFAFNQIGTKAVFYSKARVGEPTWKLTLRKGNDEFEIEEAPKREALPEPGMDVVITGLTQDPTRPRAALSPEPLAKYLGEWFDYYLREGSLELAIEAKGRTWKAEPPLIKLPPIGEGFRNVFIKGDPTKPLRCALWFDPSTQGKVAISHQGVVVIDDIRRIEEIHPGFAETIYASGQLRGIIDVDFLKPLPARTGFEVDAGWVSLMSWLESAEASIKKEVQEYQLEKELQRIELVRDEARKLAEDILEGEPFEQLELLAGMRRKRAEPREHRTTPRGEATGTRSRKTGDKRDPAGLRFSFKEVPLDDIWRHSIFEAGLLKVNTRNPNYIQLVVKGTKPRATRYVALLIGKETVAFNDKTQATDYYLEKLLAFALALESRMRS